MHVISAQSPYFASFQKYLKKVQLCSIILKQNFFYKYQFGFRKIHSINHTTSLLTENIAEAFQNKKHVLGIFLNLSKAFDNIDHKVLLSKLWHCGICCAAYDWFSSYTSNRKKWLK